MSSGSDEERVPEDETEAEREAIAKRLSEVLGDDPVSEPEEKPHKKGQGPDRPPGGIQLDSTGALADTPKLEPRRPYGRAGRDLPPAEPARETVAGPGQPPRKAAIPPPLSSLRPAELADEDLPADDEVAVAGGRFLFGESREAHEVPAFRIDRYPVTNADYELFVRKTGHRPPLYWIDGNLPEELRDHPVVGVDYFDALAYAKWRGKDLPYEDEWERAARGTDGRTYPWGNEPDLAEANTARLGHKMTVPIGWFPRNVSPEGVHDLVGNVWEMTHSPAPGGGVVVRGGSWYDFVLYAKGWFRFASRVDARNGTIGFRCVRREAERTDAAREISEHRAEAEIATRRGPQSPFDPTQFSAERRDLVPDYRRLRQLRTERREEKAAAAPGPMPVTGRKVPVRATPPPPLGRAGAPAPPKPARPPAEPEKAEPPKPPAEPVKAEPPKPKEAPKPKEPAKAQKGPPPPPAPKAPPKKKPERPEKPKKEEAPPPKAREPVEAQTAASREAPAVEETKPDQVPAPAAPETVPAGLDRAGLEHATDVAARTAEVKAREERERAGEPVTPLVYWLFLGAGVVLIGTLLTLLVVGLVGEGEPEEPVTVVEQPPGETPPPVRPPRPQLPPADPNDPRANDPPRILDGAREDWAGVLGEGVWFLVFLDPNEPASEASTLSARTASNLHRRMRDSTAQVLLVFPRAPFVGDDGRLLPDRDRLDLLRYFGGAYDVNVLLDAPTGPPFGGAARARYRVKDATYVVVLVDGRIEYRMSPLEGGFTVTDLEPLAVRTTKLRTPAPLPPDDDR